MFLTCCRAFSGSAVLFRDLSVDGLTTEPELCVSRPRHELAAGERALHAGSVLFDRHVDRLSTGLVNGLADVRVSRLLLHELADVRVSRLLCHELAGSERALHGE